MKRFLRGVSRGLAVTVLSAVIAFCPCLAPSGMAMEDCCQPSGLSMTGICCVRAEGQPAAVSSTPLPASMPALLASVVVEPVPLVRFTAAAMFVRPVVARAILRI